MMDNIEYVYTRGMTDNELAEKLSTSTTGVLALANSGDAYAIPLAHHYDGEHLYFRLGVTDGSQKQAFLEGTSTATYVLYGDTGAAGSWDPDSWSVIVTGQLVELPASEEEQFDAATVNRAFSAIRVFDEAIEDVEIQLIKMDIDSLAGRTTLRND